MGEGRQTVGAPPLACVGGLGPGTGGSGCGKQRDLADWLGRTAQKHKLTYFRSVPRASRKPDALPDSASQELLRAVLEVTAQEF